MDQEGPEFAPSVLGVKYVIDKTVLVWWNYPTMVTFLVRFLAFKAGIFLAEN